jgi:hypothetical protein
MFKLGGMLIMAPAYLGCALILLGFCGLLLYGVGLLLWSMF